MNNQDILKLTTLLNCRVAVELPRKSKIIAQCKLCQRFSISQNYCNKTPRCVKYGEKAPNKELQQN